VVVPVFGLIGYLVQRTLIQKSIDRDPFTTLLVTFGLSVVIENLLLEGYSANAQTVNIGSLGYNSWHPVQSSICPTCRWWYWRRRWLFWARSNCSSPKQVSADRFARSRTIKRPRS